MKQHEGKPTGTSTGGRVRDDLRISRAMLALPIALCLSSMLCLACDRNVEPYRPGEQSSQPDLSRIFPQPDEERAQMAGNKETAPPGGQRVNAGSSTMGARTDGAAPSAIGERAASGSGPVRGRVELAAEHAGTNNQGATLFIIARRSGIRGQPLAVLRVVNPRLPLDFEIGPAQVLMPTERFEGSIELAARLDTDGNAMTKLPGDLSSAAPTTVSPGDSGVVLTLDQKL